jgi:triosephosphate isomerase
MRTKYIAGNWKMNGTIAEATALAKEIKAELADADFKYLVAPVYTAIAAVKEVLEGSNVMVGAQDMSNLESGARTGDIAVAMLKELGVDAVILGHSERRQYHGETDALVNEKIKLALANDLEVIYCCGELLEEREAGKAVDVVNTQIKAAFDGISAGDLAKITIAYEPVWAIGTGKTATPEDANDMHKEIRKTVADLYSKDVADAIIIQYGGSVKPGNAKDLLNMDNIDGALVGGASLKAELFGPIAKFNK